jgi:cation:H+ antiporter
MTIAGIIESSNLKTALISDAYLGMKLLAVFLAVAIFASCIRSKSAPGHAYLGRSPGTLLVSPHARYHHPLESAL